MRDLAILLLHLPATIARLVGPGGTRAVVAESVLVKHQLLILNRSRQRSPNLRSLDRVIAASCACLIRPSRLIRSAVVFKPSTLLTLHRALIQRKYRRLFSSNRLVKPGPKGPSPDVIAAVVDMKRRNPRHRGAVDSVALCRMFNRASSGQPLPMYRSTDHDPLYRFQQ